MGLFQSIKKGIESGMMQGQVDMMIESVGVKANAAINKITEKITISNNGSNVNKIKMDVEAMFCDEIVKYVNEYIKSNYSGVDIDFRELLHGNQSRETKICRDVIRESDIIINSHAVDISSTIKKKYNVNVEKEIKAIYKYRKIEKEDEPMDVVKKIFKL